jgi:hypothetical protein
MSPPRKEFEPFGDPARRLRDTIAPGTTGDPNDDMNDFPLIRDAGEKPHSNSRKRRTKTDAGDEPKEPIEVFWHGRVDYRASRPQLVQDVIPEVGHGLWSGQWGTF